MGVKRWKKKADDRSVWVIILMGQWLNCKYCVPMNKKNRRRKKKKKKREEEEEEEEG